MSTEMTAFDANNPEQVSEYLQRLQTGEQDEQLHQLAQEANPFDVMPKLVLSDNTKEVRAVLGEETVETFSSKNPLFMLVILMAESRALWRPDSMKRENDDRDKFPICSTSRVPIGTFMRENDRGVGTWRVEDNPELAERWIGVGPDDPIVRENEGTQLIRCDTCNLNKFKSVGDFDGSGEGRGKACGEGRLLIGYVCKAVGDLRDGLKVFGFDPAGVRVYAQLSASSIGTVKQIGTACVSRRTPARYCVFQLGCEPQSSGQMKWGRLTQQFSGFVAPNLIDAADEAYKSMTALVIKDQVAPKYGDEPDPPERGTEQEGKHPTEKWNDQF